jgi:hypothetical protein
MDAQVACETVMESRMTLLHVLLDEGVEPAVLVPLFELLATEASAALGSEHELTMEADLGAQLCREAAAATAMTDVELVAHSQLLEALDAGLVGKDDALRAEIEQLLAEIESAIGQHPALGQPAASPRSK